MKRQVFPVIGTGDYYKAQYICDNDFFFLSSGVRFCHFIQFNCGVALRHRFHAYVVSVYLERTGFLITRGKESLAQNDHDLHKQF